MPRVESMIHDEVLEKMNDISLQTEFALLYDPKSFLCQTERRCMSDCKR